MRPAVTMFAFLLSIASFAVAAGQPPQGGPYEVLVKDMLGLVDDITKTLTTIKDRESAGAARPVLKKDAQKLLDLRQKAAEWKQPNKDEKDRLEKEYAPKMEKAVKKLRDETIRVKGIAGGEEAVSELAILNDKEKDKDKKGGKRQ